MSKEIVIVLYKLDEGAKTPVKLGDPTDAGYDIYTNSDPVIVGERLTETNDGDDMTKYNLYKSIDYIQYHTGLYIEPAIKDKPIRIDLRPRSSISNYWLTLCNTPATIDHTYGGEILVRFRPVWQPSQVSCIKKEVVTTGDIEFCWSLNMDKIYKKGDRICQALIEYTKDIHWVEVDKIDNNRQGFGSTGS